jgi:hypothetical protein
VRLVHCSLSLFVGLVLAGCGSTQQFTPADRVTSLSPAGYPAAEYDVDSTLGEFSDAKVWSRGAYSQEIAGEKRTVVHVGFEIENHMNQPIQFDAHGVRLESLATDNKEAPGEIAPGWVQGDSTLGAQDSKRLDVYFVLPTNVSPSDVDGFRVRWALNGAFQHYAQRTPFLKEPSGNYSGPTAGTITAEEPDNSGYYDRSEIIGPQQGGAPSLSSPLGGPGLP